MSTAAGWCGHGPHTGVGRPAPTHTTAIPQQHTAEDGHHPLVILPHCSRSHNQRTIMINMINHRSMIDQRTMNDEHDDDQR
nr:MAG TPA: hypothetical protein [Caudoviricetes sp.]